MWSGTGRLDMKKLKGVQVIHFTSKWYKNNQLIQWKQNVELGQQHRPRNLLPVSPPHAYYSQVWLPFHQPIQWEKVKREQQWGGRTSLLLREWQRAWKPTWKALQSHGQGSSELEVNMWGQISRTETVSTKSFSFALLDPESALETSSMSLSPENLQRREEGGCKIQLSPHPCKTPGGLATLDALSDSCWVGKGSVPSGVGEDTPGQGWLLRPPPHNPSFLFSPSISPHTWGFGGVWIRLPYLCSKTKALPYPPLQLHHSYLLTSAEGAGEWSGDTNSHSRVNK